MKTFLACVLGLTSVAGVPSESRTGLAPHESVLSTVHAVRRNDVSALVRSLFTDDQITLLRQEWDTQRKTKLDPAEDEAFQAFMAQLTAPGAERKIMEELEPQLDEMRPQVAMLVGMFSGMGQAAIAQNETLSPEERAVASRMVGAIGQALLDNDITDVGTAKKAVGVVCQTARRLRMNSLSEVQALEFDDLLKRGDVVLKGLKDVFALYGLSVDDWLATFRAETLDRSGKTATVRVHYEILGVKESSDYEMVQVDGRWVRKEAAELQLGF